MSEEKTPEMKEAEKVNAELQAKEDARIAQIKKELTEEFEGNLTKQVEEAVGKIKGDYNSQIEKLNNELSESKKLGAENETKFESQFKEFNEKLEELKPRKGMVDATGNPYTAPEGEEQGIPKVEVTHEERVNSLNKLERTEDLEAGQAFIDKIKEN